jgi:hypothetical protein
MKIINAPDANANGDSAIDDRLRWNSTTNQLVKFSVTPEGTAATVDGAPGGLPQAVKANTSMNAIYMLARQHSLQTVKIGDTWQIHFLGPECGPNNQRIDLMTYAAAPCMAEACAAAACGAEACAGVACAAEACAGAECTVEACSGAACAAARGGGKACSAEACAAAACAAAACSGAGCAAHACGANACCLDLGILPCPAEACFMHIGIPECPFIL